VEDPWRANNLSKAHRRESRCHGAKDLWINRQALTKPTHHSDFASNKLPCCRLFRRFQPFGGTITGRRLW